MSGRDARRRRIIEGGQNRLALITRRKTSPDPDSDIDSDSYPLNGQSFASTYTEEELPSRSVPSTQHDHGYTSFQKDSLHSEIVEESFVRRPEPRAEPSRAPAREDINTAGMSPAVPKPVLIFVSAAVQLAQKIPIGNLSAQQVNMGVTETEYERILCALIMGVLVVLSYAGFPIVGSRIFRWILLFRPLVVLLMVNTGLIGRRILHNSQKTLARGDKEKEKKEKNSILGDGLAWAEDAGRALELGLMLQSATWALLMDCTVYAVVIVFFLTPFV